MGKTEIQLLKNGEVPQTAKSGKLTHENGDLRNTRHRVHGDWSKGSDVPFAILDSCPSNDL